MKKLLALCAAIFLLCGTISGCGQEPSPLPVVSTTFYGQSFPRIFLPIGTFQEQFNEKAPEGYRVDFSENATNYYKQVWEDGTQLSLTYDDTNESIVSVHLSFSLSELPDTDLRDDLAGITLSILNPSSTEEQRAQALQELGLNEASFDSWEEGQEQETSLNGLHVTAQKSNGSLTLEIYPESEEVSQG